MTEYVLSIDPGLSTGVALLSYGEDSPVELVEGWQFTGGVAGLIQGVERHYRGPSWGWQFPGRSPLFPRSGCRREVHRPQHPRIQLYNGQPRAAPGRGRAYCTGAYA